MAVSARTNAMARRLWASRPAVYRQGASCSTDVWEADAAILRSKRHRPVGTDRGATHHSERCNTTLRQRCSRLVRKTRSFAQKLAKHIGALWHYIHHHNAVQRAKLDITTLA